MSKRKYEPYMQVCDISIYEMCEATWFEVRKNGKISMRHRSALESLQLRTLRNLLHSGNVYACQLKGLEK